MKNVTPLSQVYQLGTGCSIAATRFVITGIVKTFNSKPGSPKVWTAHICSVEDNGFKGEVKFWNRDIGEINNLIGQQIEVEASEYKGKAKGLEVGEDNRQNPQLSISESCSISWIDGGQNSAPRNQPPQRQQQAPQRQYQQPSQRQQQPQQGYQQQAPQQRQQQSAQRQQLTVPGITVGMAINNAVNLISKNAEFQDEYHNYLKSPEFSRDVYEIASDIIRISRMLEAGNTAPPVKDRVPFHARKTESKAAPPPRQDQPAYQEDHNNDHSRQDHPAAESEFGDGPITDGMGLDGDDIPFN